MKLSLWIKTLCICSLACLGSLTAIAQSEYPNKPVKIIVPFPPGGTTDLMARISAEQLTKILKQAFVIENVAGGGGVIGAERAAGAQPDGYTLVMTGVGQNAVAHGLDPNLKYDSMKDFAHISLIDLGPNVLVAHPDRPFKTLKDIVDFARANPGKLDYGYTYASSGHMAMELLRQATATCADPKKKLNCNPLPIVGIPYRGGGPLMNAILGNEIPMEFINQDAALPYVAAGKLRPIAVSSLQRNPLYPNVPTVAESGYPGFQALSWAGISAPKGTPKPVLDKLEAAMIQALQTPEVRQRIESVGFVIPPLGANAYNNFLKSEIELWTSLIKKSGIKPE
ncbi:tripartite tricarboxylate transporter substrate binding protein [Polynucleobacter sp. MWH-UH25E]|uniref:Bug family tripartite tricarboxylate transporter substrate binding protein n=1 Tax=Polynucleobacter sp. MWH-UH25E TaxID=1855616 RepID=UPI001BFEE64D|nr:tripartite tricarboxylate transporter substrate binding protein [Polynucleobacter sp. MWH-UH25E]QWD61436.1 tripartite tricarboxylate transporter substrate binding protein [Polynucleobacter sp. MWH-UH25E]